MRSDVAVLYVDARGPYPKLVTHWWDEERDASTYYLMLPVVAHPPCAPWSAMRHLNRYQKPEHALHALSVVRAHGGVLEHPCGSKLWDAMELPRPGAPVDHCGGFTLEVCQVDWGHVARKRTWLYVCGLNPTAGIPPMPVTRREPTHWASGGRVPREGRSASQLVPAGIKVCSAQQRRRTPPAFAEWLLELASRCGGAR